MRAQRAKQQEWLVLQNPIERDERKPAGCQSIAILVYAQSRLYVQVVQLNMLPEGYGVKMLRTESYAVL